MRFGFSCGEVGLVREGLGFAGEVGRLRGDVGNEEGERGRVGGLQNLGETFSNTSFS